MTKHLKRILIGRVNPIGTDALRFKLSAEFVREGDQWRSITRSYLLILDRVGGHPGASGEACALLFDNTDAGSCSVRNLHKLNADELSGFRSEDGDGFVVPGRGVFRFTNRKYACKVSELIEGETRPAPAADRAIKGSPSLARPAHEQVVHRTRSDRILAAAFNAGRVPILYGPRALAAALSFGQTQFDGNVTVMSMSPRMLDVGDLLNADGTELVPSIETARESCLDRPETKHLLIFEGINRCPTESVLAPLLQSRACSRRGAAKEFHLPPLARFGTEVGLIWPDNLAITCTYATGPTTLSLANDVFDDVVVVYAPGAATDVSAGPPKTTPAGVDSSPLAKTKISELNLLAAGAERFARELKNLGFTAPEVRSCIADVLYAPALMTFRRQTVEGKLEELLRGDGFAVSESARVALSVYFR